MYSPHIPADRRYTYLAGGQQQKIPLVHTSHRETSVLFPGRPKISHCISHWLERIGDFFMHNQTAGSCGVEVDTVVLLIRAAVEEEAA